MFGTPTGPTGPTPSSFGVFGGTPGGTTGAPNVFGGATATTTATAGGFGTPGGGAALRGAGFGGDHGTGVYGQQPMPYGGQQQTQQTQQTQNRRAGATPGNATPGAVKGAPRFSSLLFASPTNMGDSPGGGAGGLYRTESSMGGASTPRTSSGQNRYFGGGGATTANRGKLEERPTPAPAAVIGGVSSRGTPLFTRTETGGGGGGGDDHTPGFLRRAIEKTHAENMAASAPGDEALNAWLGSGENAKKKIESSTGKAFTVSEVLSDSEAEHWVTVYGFSKDEKALVLREFQRDGDIVNFGDFNENGESTNWLHVRFATKESARRALRRNGQNMNGIMVGVKELDAKSKADIGSGKGGEGRLSRNAAVRRVAPMRDGISLQPRQRTTWDKVVEFVFGA